MIFHNGEYVDKSILIEKNLARHAVDMPQTHSHPHYELYFLISGERRYFVGHEIFNVSAGNLVIIQKNELHRICSLNHRGYERYVLYFSDSMAENIAGLIGREHFEEFISIGCAAYTPEHASKIKGKMDLIFAEQSGSDALCGASQENFLSNIIIETLRHGKKKNCATGEGADKIQLVAAYISENYASEITLEGAAKMACMEGTYFSKRFKALTGFGFCEYLMRTRIKAAQTLLLSTELNISEISDACGFSGSNYFGDAFRRVSGMSPSQYRKYMREI